MATHRQLRRWRRPPPVAGRPRKSTRALASRRAAATRRRADAASGTGRGVPPPPPPSLLRYLPPSRGAPPSQWRYGSRRARAARPSPPSASAVGVTHSGRVADARHDPLQVQRRPRPVVAHACEPSARPAPLTAPPRDAEARAGHLVNSAGQLSPLGRRHFFPAAGHERT